MPARTPIVATTADRTSDTINMAMLESGGSGAHEDLSCVAEINSVQLLREKVDKLNRANLDAHDRLLARQNIERKYTVERLVDKFGFELMLVSALIICVSVYYIARFIRFTVIGYFYARLRKRILFYTKMTESAFRRNFSDVTRVTRHFKYGTAFVIVASLFLSWASVLHSMLLGSVSVEEQLRVQAEDAKAEKIGKRSFLDRYFTENVWYFAKTIVDFVSKALGLDHVAIVFLSFLVGLGAVGVHNFLYQCAETLRPEEPAERGKLPPAMIDVRKMMQETFEVNSPKRLRMLGGSDRGSLPALSQSPSPGRRSEPPQDDASPRAGSATPSPDARPSASAARG